MADARAPSERLAPGLYVVATPIGNLEDITLRALRVLREAVLIACEDTRHTQKLLNHFEIRTKTQSYHEHNEAQRANELLDRVAAGERVALVSDAGMPGISDPGHVVIAEAIRRGLPVMVVPGASAALTALVASGLETSSFRFVGFLPARAGERRSALERLREERDTIIFYEAPHRIAEMLSDLESVFGGSRRVCIARELTKLHEEFVRGTVAEVRQALSSRESVKGEIAVVVAGYSEGEPQPSGKADLASRMRQLISEGASEKDALKQVARVMGLGKSEAYREWQRARNRVIGPSGDRAK
jgi:16S rRNA (cytidine1402-2'-O)-methyltransferase